MSRYRIATFAATLAAGLLVATTAQPLTTGSLTDAEALGALKETLTQGADAAVGKWGVPDFFLGNRDVRIKLPR